MIILVICYHPSAGHFPHPYVVAVWGQVEGGWGLVYVEPATFLKVKARPVACATSLPCLGGEFGSLSRLLNSMFICYEWTVEFTGESMSSLA